MRGLSLVACACVIRDARPFTMCVFFCFPSCVLRRETLCGVHTNLASSFCCRVDPLNRGVFFLLFCFAV